MPTLLVREKTEELSELDLARRHIKQLEKEKEKLRKRNEELTGKDKKNKENKKERDRIKAFLFSLTEDVLKKAEKSCAALNKTRKEYLDELVSILLASLDEELGGISILGITKVPFNQAMAVNGEKYTDPNSLESAHYYFSKDAIAQVSKQNKKPLKPDTSAHNQLNAMLKKGVPVWDPDGSSLSKQHPIALNKLFFLPIKRSFKEGAIGFFSHAKASLSDGVRAALEDFFPFFWQAIINQGIERYAKTRYINKLYPKFIINLLKKQGYESAEKIVIACPEASLFFCDIVGFTKASKGMNPEGLTNDLRAFFTLASKISEKYGIALIKTIGDAIMAVGGLPESASFNQPAAIVNFAQDLIKAIDDAQLKINKTPIKIRVGIDVGKIELGLVGPPGQERLDAFGETVNRAARLEEAGKASRIHISPAMTEKLDKKTKLEWHSVNLKGLSTKKACFVAQKEHVKSRKINRKTEQNDVNVNVTVDGVQTKILWNKLRSSVRKNAGSGNGSTSQMLSSAKKKSHNSNRPHTSQGAYGCEKRKKRPGHLARGNTGICSGMWKPINPNTSSKRPMVVKGASVNWHFPSGAYKNRSIG